MELTAELLRQLIDYDPETGVITWRPRKEKSRHDRMWNTRFAFKVAGTTDTNGYLCVSFRCVKHRAHRLAWLYVHGRWPADQLDHINRDRADNRLANLRECTGAENHQNRGVRAKSGVQGVRWHKQGQKWQARIRINGREVYLGLHETVEAASQAYQEAKGKYHRFGTAQTSKHKSA